MLIFLIALIFSHANQRKRYNTIGKNAFDSRNQRQFFHFDIIRVRDEKSSSLIRKHSLLCKLLALKADDEGTDPEMLIREIYQAAAEMKEELTNDQMLLIGQWTEFYKKIPDETLVKIRKEEGMQPVATTISEHIFNLGEAEGIAKGRAEGIAEGKIEGQIAVLESLFRQGILSEEQMKTMLIPLRSKLKKLKPGNKPGKNPGNEFSGYYGSSRWDFIMLL